jgi:hypothetical protein
VGSSCGLVRRLEGEADNSAGQVQRDGHLANRSRAGGGGGGGVILGLHSNEAVSGAYALAPLTSVIHAGSGSLGLGCRRQTSGTSPSFCTWRARSGGTTA